jgi:RNA polymerase sigma-70 factor (ECF subfamily)
VAEVAELLGVAEGTVKSRCFRARVALAAMLRAGEEEGEPASSPVNDGSSQEQSGNPRRRGRVEAGDGEGGERVRNG